MHPRTAAIIVQVTETFGQGALAVDEMADGSIWVCAEVDLGPGWRPSANTLSVKLAPSFPDSAPYPWYLTAGTARTDGAPVERLSGPIELDGRTLLQLSLNAPWGVDSSLADRMVAVVRWIRRAGSAAVAS